MLILILPHMHFFHFSDTCYFGSNGSTKVLESTIVFDSFLEALVLKCYAYLPLGFLSNEKLNSLKIPQELLA
jgi:hypothetical protein